MKNWGGEEMHTPACFWFWWMGYQSLATVIQLELELEPWRRYSAPRHGAQPFVGIDEQVILPVQLGSQQPPQLELTEHHLT